MCKAVLGSGDMKMNPRQTVYALKEGMQRHKLRPKCEGPSVMGQGGWVKGLGERSQGIWTQGASVLLLILGQQEAIPDKPGSERRGELSTLETENRDCGGTRVCGWNQTE